MGKPSRYSPEARFLSVSRGVNTLAGRVCQAESGVRWTADLGGTRAGSPTTSRLQRDPRPAPIGAGRCGSTT